MKIKNGGLPEEDGISIFSLKVEYLQKEDICDTTGVDQILTIETQNGGCDAEHTYFIIKTERWAIEGPESIARIVEDFQDRFYFNK